MHLHLLHISKWLNSFVNTTIQYSILQIYIALLMFDKNENCHLCIELFLILFVTRLLLLLSPGRSAKYIRLQFYQFSCDYYFIHQKRQIESLDFPFGKQTDTQTHFIVDISISIPTIILSQAHRHATIDFSMRQRSNLVWHDSSMIKWLYKRNMVFNRNLESIYWKNII